MGMSGAFCDDGGSYEQRQWLNGGRRRGGSAPTVVPRYPRSPAEEMMELDGKPRRMMVVRRPRRRGDYAATWRCVELGLERRSRLHGGMDLQHTREEKKEDEGISLR